MEHNASQSLSKAVGDLRERVGASSLADAEEQAGVLARTIDTVVAEICRGITELDKKLSGDSDELVTDAELLPTLVAVGNAIDALQTLVGDATEAHGEEFTVAAELEALQGRVAEAFEKLESVACNVSVNNASGGVREEALPAADGESVEGGRLVSGLKLTAAAPLEIADPLSVEPGVITLTASDVGMRSFVVDDIRQDDQGVDQIAPATFSFDDGDDFLGGTPRLGVPPITAPMTGDAESSLRAFEAAIDLALAKADLLGGIRSVELDTATGVFTLTAEGDPTLGALIIRQAEIDAARPLEVDFTLSSDTADDDAGGKSEVKFVAGDPTPVDHPGDRGQSEPDHLWDPSMKSSA